MTVPDLCTEFPDMCGNGGGTVGGTNLVGGTDPTGTGDGCTDIGYDPSFLSADAPFDPGQFAAYLRSHAETASVHKCAHYVRMALCNGGGIGCGGGPDAWQYGPFLTKLGFTAITNGAGLSYPAGYTPQVGDIAVFSSYTPGHVCAWDGTNWTSDYIQSSTTPEPNPNSNPNLPYTIYRKP